LLPARHWCLMANVSELGIRHFLRGALVRHFSPHSASPASVVLPPRPVEVRAGEVEVLRRELWQARRRLEAAEEEVLRLDATLALRAREYEDLRRNSERALQEAHGRSWELEEALAEVQRRMAGSEARVRQMQAHLVTVRENLVEELRVQLHDARTHREAAVAELERTREELGHHQREVEEQKERSGALLQEVQRLTEELLSKDEHTKALKASLANLEARKAQMACKHIQTPSEWQLKSSKTTMTDITKTPKSYLIFTPTIPASTQCHFSDALEASLKLSGIVARGPTLTQDGCTKLHFSSGHSDEITLTKT
uniref:Coiled-coil alpha-helical rod protein 1 n=1 Tax=Astyanax mexicanus TaxID=7994 RepID=A0A3B1JDQ1_ASTMX